MRPTIDAKHSMNTRNLMLLIGTLCAGAAAGLWFFSQGAQAIALPKGDDPVDIHLESPIASADQLPATAAEGSYRKSSHGEVAAVTAQRTPDNQDTSGWTSGIIRGDVKLAVSVIDKLASITVIVEEVRNHMESGAYKAPTRMYAQVDRGEGTPTFQVTNVPFSEYPYRVTLHAAGLNGSQKILTVNKEQPLHDIVLAITPGAPFSVLLRDQDSGKHPNVDLLMRPVGLPNGRPRLTGKTDNFGSVRFENVLAGNYELVATLDGQAFGDVETVTVLPGSRNYGRKIQGQGHTMTIARGVQVDVRVHDLNGYGIADCTVTATATDRRTLTEFSGKTDNLGQLRFAHLKPGTWQFTVQCQGFQRVDQHLTLKPDQEPMQRDIRIVRVRGG
jgi:hypothetical protein